ncbi:MAG: sulfate reduction electron transfer complex DsrMKJOP subunit DsrO [Candidatus Latescibacterota bacterium]
MNRRDFLKTGGILLVGTPCVYGLRMLTPAGSSASSEALSTSVPRWGMIIDLNKCAADCTDCMEACRAENNVALHGSQKWDIHWIRKVQIKSKDPAIHNEKSVPLLCNHCDKPPCALVCPVKATYKRADGIVIVDQHRCIGCRYCMIACPYNARYFNFKENHDWSNKDYPKRSHGVTESCTLCAHLLDQGRMPACAQACQKKHGALLVGDLNDPDSDIARLIANNPVKRLREDLGTEPKVFYIGL